MPALRAFVALILVGWIGAWLTSAPLATATHPDPVPVTVPATTTTVAPTTTTTLLLAAAPRPRPRAARAAVRPRPDLTDEIRQRVITAICSHDWDCQLMVRVGGCESGLNPWSVNPRSGATGIFQILHATPGLIEEHVDLAYAMWRNRGMAPWAESRSCWS